jgi:hypothetical protein
VVYSAAHCFYFTALDLRAFTAAALVYLYVLGRALKAVQRNGAESAGYYTLTKTEVTARAVTRHSNSTALLSSHYETSADAGEEGTS